MPTIADVLVGGLLRAGTSRLFAVAAARDSSLVSAARDQGLPVSFAGSDAGAVLMAVVTGELTGAPGACIGDPALASVATALAYARAEWAPGIVITERNSDERPPALDALVKQSLRVEASSAAHWIAHAARLALAEPPGPVHLDVRGDVRTPSLPVAARATPDRPAPPDAEALDRAAALIGAAHRPLIVAGHGARAAGTIGWLRAFCEALPAPVLATVKARGVMPDPHPLMLGTIDPGAADLIARADLLVLIGADPIELAGVGRADVPVLRLARAAIDAAWPRVLDLVGDPGLALEELAPRLRDVPRADWDVAELDRLKRARAAVGLDTTAGRVVRAARELTPAGTTAVVDTGEHAAAVTATWQAVMPGELLAASITRVAGFGLPAAIAAQLARPSHRVLCFTSGRGVMAARDELATLAPMEPGPILIVLPEPTADLDVAAAVRAAGVRVAAIDEAGAVAAEIDRALMMPGPSAILVGDGRGRSLAFARGPR